MADDPRSLRRDITRLEAAFAQIARQVEASSGTTQIGQIAALAQGLSAVNNKTQRAAATVASLAVGNVDVTITWPTPWPDTSYGVIPTIVSGTAALGNLTATLKVGSKTTTACLITVANTGTGPVGTFVIDTVGIRT